jgi:hypothetical protein
MLRPWVVVRERSSGMIDPSLAWTPHGRSAPAQPPTCLPKIAAPAPILPGGGSLRCVQVFAEGDPRVVH